MIIATDESGTLAESSEGYRSDRIFSYRFSSSPGASILFCRRSTSGKAAQRQALYAPLRLL